MKKTFILSSLWLVPITIFVYNMFDAFQAEVETIATLRWHDENGDDNVL